MNCYFIEQMRRRRRREPCHTIYLAVTWPRWHKLGKNKTEVLYMIYFLRGTEEAWFSYFLYIVPEVGVLCDQVAWNGCGIGVCHWVLNVIKLRGSNPPHNGDVLLRQQIISSYEFKYTWIYLSISDSFNDVTIYVIRYDALYELSSPIPSPSL
jgi:hypothetical protein